MTKDDLKQIGDLLDEKLDQKLERAISEIANIVNTAFSEHEASNDKRFEAIDSRFDTIERRLDKVEEKLDDKPDANKIFSWADNMIIPVSRDVDRLKFLHMNDMKNVPDNLTISSALQEEGLN